MRVTCPCCAARFDVPHRAVLAEAARLAAHQSQAVLPAGPDADGNRADAGDSLAVQARRVAIRRSKISHCG